MVSTRYRPRTGRSSKCTWVFRHCRFARGFLAHNKSVPDQPLRFPHRNSYILHRAQASVTTVVRRKSAHLCKPAKNEDNVPAQGLAGVAQAVEQRIRNAWVGGSNPSTGTITR